MLLCECEKPVECFVIALRRKGGKSVKEQESEGDIIVENFKMALLVSEVPVIAGDMPC